MTTNQAKTLIEEFHRNMSDAYPQLTSPKGKVFACKVRTCRETHDLLYRAIERIGLCNMQMDFGIDENRRNLVGFILDEEIPFMQGRPFYDA